ncbi:wd40 repeat protein [Fusarium pseudocircinatum]|uniref:Wd40 repeat protein n=1 Tax=Fusarium pseudocircinatum TaxID=56676 RepID=A0A8H5LBF4_9HYPO|nr:wd40 repeat protein [Fusarium pseudocircinatum]
MNTVKNLFGFGNSEIHVGDRITVNQGDSKCLADLRGTDPRLDKQRIQEIGGGLLANLCSWVFVDASFKKWTEQQGDSSRLLWVKGDSGKGKTMLLCSIIDHLQEIKAAKLAYFFCQASDQNLSSSVAVLRGLVYMLADEYEVVRQLAEEKHKNAGRNLFWDNNAWFALKELFSEILERSDWGPMVIVIDALDECTSGLVQLLNLVITISESSPRVRWIISSRNYSNIENHLEESTRDPIMRIELGASSEAASFRTYLQSKVDTLAHDESYDQETKLAVRLHFERSADVNLLWVSLVCQSLQEVPKEHVKDVVQRHPRGLDGLYLHLLTQVLRPVRNDTCRQVLAVVTVVSRPISLVELSCLVGITEKDAARVVSLCHAFLTLQDNTIYFGHQSAKDFLLSSAAYDAPMSFNAIAMHGWILQRSLRAMESALQRDIYNLQRPGFYINDVTVPEPDPLARLHYSCLYWVDHLAAWAETPENPEEVSECLRDGGLVDQFFRNSFLNWLEAVSLLKSFPSGVRLVTRLLILVKKQGIGGNGLCDLIHDAHRLMRFHQAGIENYPLQVYAAALIFSPSQSPIRQIFQADEPRDIVIKPVIEKYWSSLVQTFEGHDDRVVAMASNTGTNHITVASAAQDGTIKVWEATTGESFHTFKISRYRRSQDGILLAFPEGRDVERLISSSEHRVHIWNLRTGECEGELRDPTNLDIIDLSFFNDTTNECVTLTAQGEAKIWNLDTHELVRSTTIWTQDIRKFVLGWIAYAKFACDSRGKTLLLVRSRPIFNLFKSTRPMTVWEIETGTCLQTIEDCATAIGTTAFSPNGALIAVNTDHQEIDIWDVATGQRIRTLYWGEPLSLTFSNDSTRLASLVHGGDSSATVEVRNMVTGESVRTFDVLDWYWLPGFKRTVHFLGDSNPLAVSTDKTVSIWDMTSQESDSYHPDTTRSPVRVRISANERYLIWASDHIIQIHDLDALPTLLWGFNPPADSTRRECLE